VDAVRGEMQESKERRQALLLVWNAAKEMWQDTSARYDALMKWLEGKIERSTFKGSFPALQVELLKVKPEVTKAVNCIDTCEKWLNQLEEAVTLLQAKVAVAENEPALTRKQFLESLFCVPLRFSAPDLEESKSSSQRVGNGKDVEQLTVAQLLLRKQERTFVEREDFVPYLEDSKSPLLIQENFPPENGPEREALLETIHKRTMKALEHINELICHAIEADSSLQASRERVCVAFGDEITNLKTSLDAIVDINKATIWPTLYSASERVHLLSTAMQAVNTAAADGRSQLPNSPRSDD
jgi:hypothetical protein